MSQEKSPRNLYQAWTDVKSRRTPKGEFQFLVQGLGREGEQMPSSAQTEADQSLACGRLLDLGIVAGEVLVVQLRAAWSEPIYIEVQGAQFALRRTEAECIFGRDLSDLSTATEERK
ncbi:MAG TPA: FeoA family protein [Pseudobdellovibrionaceae bacterium]|nr:FeoA family protein [Pseudobdellovibrionaceae bacterium]